MSDLSGYELEFFSLISKMDESKLIQFQALCRGRLKSNKTMITLLVLLGGIGGHRAYIGGLGSAIAYIFIFWVNVALAGVFVGIFTTILFIVWDARKAIQDIEIHNFKIKIEVAKSLLAGYAVPSIPAKELEAKPKEDIPQNKTQDNRPKKSGSLLRGVRLSGPERQG